MSFRYLWLALGIAALRERSWFQRISERRAN